MPIMIYQLWKAIPEQLVLHTAIPESEKLFPQSYLPAARANTRRNNGTNRTWHYFTYFGK
jgi:hypothetical protein